MTRPTIGWWYTLCCAEDTYRIDTEADLAEVIDMMENEERELSEMLRVWPTFEQAYQAAVEAGDEESSLALLRERASK